MPNRRRTTPKVRDRDIARTLKARQDAMAKFGQMSEKAIAAEKMFWLTQISGLKRRQKVLQELMRRREGQGPRAKKYVDAILSLNETEELLRISQGELAKTEEKQLMLVEKAGGELLKRNITLARKNYETAKSALEKSAKSIEIARKKFEKGSPELRLAEKFHSLQNIQSLGAKTAYLRAVILERREGPIKNDLIANLMGTEMELRRVREKHLLSFMD